MSTHLEEKELAELFRRDAAIPAAAQERLDHAYGQIRQECRDKQEKGNLMHIHNKHRTRVVVTVAAAAAVLAGTALAMGFHADFIQTAIGFHTDFIQTAFGNEVEGREEFTLEKGGGDEETYPAVERVPVDADTAEALIGDSIVDVGESIEANGYTVTVESAVMDENGIACVTYTLENPEGVDTFTIFEGNSVDYGDAENIENSRLVEPEFTITSDNYQNENDSFNHLDDRTVIDESRSTDTCATLVAYITPFGTVSSDDGMLMTLKGYVDGVYTTFGSIEIPASAKLPAAEFTDGAITASISPVGIKLTYQSISQVINETETKSAFVEGGADTPEATPDGVEDLPSGPDNVVIKYADGSEYVLESSDPYLYNIGVGSTKGLNIYMAFNRLVDVDSVTAVVVDGETLTVS